MAHLHTSGAVTGTGDRSRPRAALPALCATQITSWGIVPTTTRTVTLIALGGATTAALALAPGPYPLLVDLSVAAGMARGNLTLLQATAITDRWSTTHYGHLAGLLTAPVTAASAPAPFAGAALAEPLGGYPHLFTLLALVSAAAALIAAVATTSKP